jgi:heavy metal translocating P-type ATPase
MPSQKREGLITIVAIAGIAAHLGLQYATHFGSTLYHLSLHASVTGGGGVFQGGVAYHLLLSQLPLIVVLLIGGIPLLFDLTVKLLRRDWGADLLAGIAIVTAVALEQYLAGSLIVLMLAGGQVLESYAARRASSVLQALANRMPAVAHRKTNGHLDDIGTDEVEIGDRLVVFPHEICPVDGTVIEGSGAMDESYLTGEPYVMAKVAGSSVLSGAINGDSALTIRADRRAVDSRYAKIMEVMRASEQKRPKIRRLGDQIGAVYAPFAVAIAVAAWLLSGDPIRFLAVLVIATPCPLLIGIPVAIISSISLAARREIVIKNPAILETIGTCRTAIFDKTGTLTYGRPTLTELVTAAGFSEHEVLELVAALEGYSKHPLSGAIVKAAKTSGVAPLSVSDIRELPGEGLKGVVAGRSVQITGRQQLLASGVSESVLPPSSGGLECVVSIDGRYAATLQFRDEVRGDSSSFITHLKPKHLFERVMLVSGDRESEVRYLAGRVGIDHVYFGQTPEQKLTLVRKETEEAKTVFLGDGINDAPALTAATIGIAFGQNSDITAESSDAVIMDSSLLKVDELLHIGQRMRAIALQSAVGGMMLSFVGMLFAALGFISPVTGAILQEVIDVFAVLNALRAAAAPRSLSDYHSYQAPGAVTAGGIARLEMSG